MLIFTSQHYSILLSQCMGGGGRCSLHFEPHWTGFLSKATMLLIGPEYNGFRYCAITRTKAPNPTHWNIRKSGEVNLFPGYREWRVLCDLLGPYADVVELLSGLVGLCSRKACLHVSHGSLHGSLHGNLHGNLHKTGRVQV